MTKEAAAVSIEERIQASRRLSAMQRAWDVVKAHEKGKPAFDGLRWVEPRQSERGGVTRRIDFAAEFAGDAVTLPVPLTMGVVMPSPAIAPGEDVPVSWSMPILTRWGSAPTLDDNVRSAIDANGVSVQTRNSIEVVSFLPMPREDAPADELFTPQFFVYVQPHGGLKTPSHYYAATVRYKGNVVRQFAAQDRLHIFANPYQQTLFSAEMLVSLSAEELASTSENAGTLEIFVYQVGDGLGRKRRFDLGKLYNLSGAGGSSGFGSQSSSLTFPTLGGDSPRGGDSRSYGDVLEGGGGFSGLTALPGGGQSSRPSPASVPRQVGDVRLGEGASLGEAEYGTLDGYGFDAGVSVQPIRIRLLGVREGSSDAVLDAVRGVAASYRR